MHRDINRLKVVLVEKKRTNKWLAEQLGKDPATVSKWCTNAAQPTLETLIEIAKCLQVEIQELFYPIDNYRASNEKQIFVMNQDRKDILSEKIIKKS